MPNLPLQSPQSAPTPPIPPVPAQPGAATGAPTVTVTRVQTGTDANANAEQAIQNAIQAAQNAADAAAAGRLEGQAGIVVQPPPVYRVDPDIPPEVVPIIGIIFGSIAFMVVVSPIVRGIMKYIERRQDRAMVHGPSVANQLMQLQQSVDALAIEVERISESQRFLAKISAEKDKTALPSGKGGA